MKLGQAVLDEIQRRFATIEVGQVVTALENLSGSLEGMDDPVGEERMQFAILKLSRDWLRRGNLGRFRRALELAESDFRDLLFAAKMSEWDWPDVVVDAGIANTDWHRQVVAQLGDFYSQRHRLWEFWKMPSKAEQAAEQRVVANLSASVPGPVPMHPLQGALKGATIYAEQMLKVGQETFVDSASPAEPFAVAFEDDGTTGSFYALDLGTRGKPPILDALHIYSVADVADRDIPSTVQIAWSADGFKAILIINDYAHAVFDLEARRGYCRTGLPPPDTRWTKYDHAWADSALELFK